MATFKDSTGKEWKIRLDGPTIREVRSRCDGFDLIDSTGKSFERLQSDLVLLPDILWVLCEKQAREANITDVQFGESLVGDAIDDATAAMLAAIADFFPPSKRALILALAEKNTTLRKLGMERAMATINDPETEKMVLDAIEKRMRNDIQETLTRLSSATDTRDSSASPPTD